MPAKKHVEKFCPKCGKSDLHKDGFTTNEGSRKQRYRCGSCGFKTTSPPSSPPKEIEVMMRKRVPVAKRYVVTSAQNATPIHRPTWETLKCVAAYYHAELVVIPGRYKNPTSQWTQANKEHEWWDAAVVPYLANGLISLCDRLIILGDVKVQWAARRPLVGLDALTKDKSGIIGHGSRGLRSIATPQHKHAKLMATTGACTVPNYTDTKQGRLAKFHHCFGALIVEVDNDAFYMRQLNATAQGHIIDLDIEFTPDAVRPARPALAVSFGDIHQRWVLPEVVKATFDAPGSLVKMLNPQYLFWHDTLDFHARNHHHKGDWVTAFAKWKHEIESVEEEVLDAVTFVNKHTTGDRRSVVVSSNHDRAMERWLKETDFRTDPVNAEFYLECARRALESAKKTGGGVSFDDPFISYAKKHAKPSVQFLKPGESKVLADVEYGFHGDMGPNGSRGTTRNLSKMGIKVTKGHSHIAEIEDGCYSAGKSTGMLEYERGGPSAHTNSHVVQYANGKRAIITIINGKFCLPRPKHTKISRAAKKR